MGRQECWIQATGRPFTGHFARRTSVAAAQSLARDRHPATRSAPELLDRLPRSMT
jgi:hypothetical protein